MPGYTTGRQSEGREGRRTGTRGSVRRVGGERGGRRSNGEGRTYDVSKWRDGFFDSFVPDILLCGRGRKGKGGDIYTLNPKP